MRNPVSRSMSRRSARLPGEDLALFKTEELEVIRLVLAAGKSLPPHKVPGEITIQCLEGRIGSGRGPPVLAAGRCSTCAAA